MTPGEAGAYLSEYQHLWTIERSATETTRLQAGKKPTNLGCSKKYGALPLFEGEKGMGLQDGGGP